jgi:hypothetical protein
VPVGALVAPAGTVILGAMTSPEWLESWSPDDGARRVRALFTTAFGADGGPDGVWSAPGRVNLIGEHTDYNGGLALPIALPHRTYVALRRRDDDAVRLVVGSPQCEVHTVHLLHVPIPKVKADAIYARGIADGQAVVVDHDADGPEGIRFLGLRRRRRGETEDERQKDRDKCGGATIHRVGTG